MNQAAQETPIVGTLSAAQETTTVDTLRKLLSRCDANVVLKVEAQFGSNQTPLLIDHLRFQADGEAVILRLKLQPIEGGLASVGMENLQLMTRSLPPIDFEAEQRQMIKEEQRRAELQDKAQAEMQTASQATPIYDSLKQRLEAVGVQLDRTYEQTIAAVTYQLQQLAPPERLEFVKVVRELLTGGEVRLTEAGYTLPVDKQVEGPAATKQPTPLLIDGFPRRNRRERWTPIEHAIWDAKYAVEKGPAHPLMTEATILLTQAQNKVADYYELPEAVAVFNNLVILPASYPLVSNTGEVVGHTGGLDRIDLQQKPPTPEELLSSLQGDPRTSML